MEWLEVVKQVPGGLYIAGVLLLVLGGNAIFSEKTVKEKFWLFRVLFKWAQDRKEEAAALEEEIAYRRTQALWEEIARVDAERQHDKKQFALQIEELEKKEKHQHQYIVWITEKWRALEIWAAENGLVLPPPPYLTFSEWIEREEENEQTSMGDGPGVDEG